MPFLPSDYTACSISLLLKSVSTLSTAPWALSFRVWFFCVACRAPQAAYSARAQPLPLEPVLLPRSGLARLPLLLPLPLSAPPWICSRQTYLRPPGRSARTAYSEPRLSAEIKLGTHSGVGNGLRGLPPPSPLDICFLIAPHITLSPQKMCCMYICTFYIKRVKNF